MTSIQVGMQHPLSMPLAQPNRPIQSVNQPLSPSLSPDQTALSPALSRGIAPTLQAAGAGALGGAAVALLPVAGFILPATWGKPLTAITASTSAVLLSGTVGAASGAIAANVTNSSYKGALIGTGVGALAGAITLGVLNKGNVAGMVLGAAIGGISGAAGGFSSTWASHQQ